jgi:hypothetical protein
MTTSRVLQNKAFPIPTDMPGNVSSWEYAQIGGTMPFSGSDMWASNDKSAWMKLNTLDLCRAKDFLVATHICSYACYTSQFLGYHAPSTMCNLVGASTANNCLGFPAKGGWPL